MCIYLFLFLAISMVIRLGSDSDGHQPTRFSHLSIRFTWFRCFGLRWPWLSSPMDGTCI